MIRAVLDEVVPADFITLFSDEEIEVAAFPPDWRSLSDGEIFSRAVSAGYDWLVTCDKQMPFQQNLSGQPLSVLVLPTPKFLELERIGSALRVMLREPAPGHFLIVDGDGNPAGEPVPHIIGRKRKSN